MLRFAYLNRSVPVLWLAFSAAGAHAGYIETLDHTRFDGDVRVTENGTLVISVAEQQHQFSLNQVLKAQLNAPLFEPGTLPKGWRVEEIADVHGTGDETNGTYTLRVTGGHITSSKQQMAHYVYRVLRGDGEVVARIQSVEAANACLAGVMLRDSLDPYGAMAFVGVTPDHHLRFEVREGGWQSISKRDEGIVTLPIWLKLVRERKETEKEPFVTAYRSDDGMKWQPLGQMKLPWRSEPIPEGSDNWQPRIYAGIGITGPGTNTLSTAKMDHVAVIAHGLMGEYFADDRFRVRRFARIDAKIDFAWGYESPGPGIEEDHFSIRWRGKLEPKFSERYRFFFDADNDAELWVNGEKLPRVPFKKERKKEYDIAELSLNKGQKCDIKLEFTEGAGAASVRLGWSTSNQAPQTIRSSHFSYEYDPNVPDDEDRLISTNSLFAKGIWLRSGSYLVGEIVSADDSATRITWPGQKAPLMIPNTKIAHIVFRLNRRGFPLQLAEDHTGIILKNGDFLEGEFKGVNGRSLVVNSLLFGRRSFSLDNTDAVALVLNNYSPQQAPLEIRLMNGSVLRAKGLRLSSDNLLINELTLGEISIRENDIMEIVNTALDSRVLREQPRDRREFSHEGMRFGKRGCVDSGEGF
jgi:hypothetical protein